MAINNSLKLAVALFSASFAGIVSASATTTYSPNPNTILIAHNNDYHGNNWNNKWNNNWDNKWNNKWHKKWGKTVKWYPYSKNFYYHKGEKCVEKCYRSNFGNSYCNTNCW